MTRATRTIDNLAISPERRTVTLAIADTHDWRDVSAHLAFLHDKLDAYLDFVESGELWRRYPEAVGYTVQIRVFARDTPAPEATAALARMKHVVEAAGCAFRFQVGLEDSN